MASRRDFVAFPAMIGLIIVVLSVLPSRAQQAAELSSQSAGLNIRAALNEISAQQVKADIEKLVGFKTRSTISAQDAASIAAGQGVGRRGSGLRASLSATRMIAADVWR